MAEQESTLAEPVREAKGHGGIPLSAGMMLVALGVVYGDIGTSPMYTMKSVIAHNGGISQVTSDTIIGALSLIIWTLTLVTTIKYVVIAMKADNHNEGGIFALYAVVRNVAKWLIVPAMVGGAALLADGVLTPAVTVTEAVEGLRSTEVGHVLVGDEPTRVVIISIVILSLLFLSQRAGTSRIGKAFGPIMTVWFLFIGGFGLVNALACPDVLWALNPVRGVTFLFGPENKNGIMALHFVFLATTGAEALYSDMGHVGKANIYATWPMVKVCLLLNYFGQAAWTITNLQNPQVMGLESVTPFFMMLPEAIRPFGVLLSTLAAIIASQALITGSFTLVSEATHLDLLPTSKVEYPSETKGQLYIPLVNTLMWLACVCMVLIFKESQNLEAAYGLAITLTMVMTTVLLTCYVGFVMRKRALAVLFAVVFASIELCFLAACLSLFFEGAYVVAIIAATIFLVMYVWRRGGSIEERQSVGLPVSEYVGQLAQLRGDKEEPHMADNLVFLTKDSSREMVDRDVLYSIFDTYPKRADAYWFVNVEVTDEPDTVAYAINDFGTDFIFKVKLRLGFHAPRSIESYLQQIVGELMREGQIPFQDRKYSIFGEHVPLGNFRYCVIHKVITRQTDLPTDDYMIMNLKYLLRRLCEAPEKDFGIMSSSLITESVPLFGRAKPSKPIVRESDPIEVTEESWNGTTAI